MKTLNPSADHLHLRLSLNRLLGSADWRPPGMPPTAVLVVRHMPDPLPGKLVSNLSAVRVSQVWETAVLRQMDTLYHDAARPNRGQLPLSALAVLFADEAEMLACLALDMGLGLTITRWWWQALRRARPTLSARSMTQLLLDQPRLIPAVFAYGYQWQKHEAMLAMLTNEEAKTLLTMVTQTFRLPTLVSISSERLREARINEQTTVLTPPWESFLPQTAVSTTLSPIHFYLLCLSLSVINRPATVMTPAFQRQLHDWWHDQVRSKDQKDKADMASSSSLLQSDSIPEHAKSPLVTEASGNEKRPFSSSPLNEQTKKKIVDDFDNENSPQQTATQADIDPETPIDLSETLPETAVSFSEGIPTQLGGIFYLINVMVQRDMPACFEETWGLASQVGAWGTLDLLARGLLGSSFRHLQDDPVWMALAELNGRSVDELPGCNCQPTHNQPLPPDVVANDWLKGIHPDLCHWLMQVLPGIRDDLLITLGLNEVDQLVETLLLGNGRLHITHTHVDLVLPLAAVSMPVRLAGLDFDPGWQPSFGRVIQFHFE